LAVAALIFSAGGLALAVAGVAAVTAAVDNGLSGTSGLVAGVLCLVGVAAFAVGTPLGLILGLAARWRIRKSAGRLTGERVAAAAVLVSIACVILTFAAVVARNHVKEWLGRTWIKDQGGIADPALFRQPLEPESAAPTPADLSLASPVAPL
jgi:ABC-type dipeptide/oligopeptide/nickel transport system permease component